MNAKHKKIGWIDYTRLDRKNVVCKLEVNTLEETSYVKQTATNIYRLSNK